jgi:hypothetical protein
MKEPFSERIDKRANSAYCMNTQALATSFIYAAYVVPSQKLFLPSAER